MSYFKAKFTKIDFFWGSTPYPTGVLTVLPRPLSLIQEVLLLRMKRERKGLSPQKKILAPPLIVYAFLLHCVFKNVNTLIVNNFYKLQPILIVFGTLYAETTGF